MASRPARNDGWFFHVSGVNLTWRASIGDWKYLIAFVFVSELPAKVVEPDSLSTVVHGPSGDIATFTL
mgnify:CR=1 FL=1